MEAVEEFVEQVHQVGAMAGEDEMAQLPVGLDALQQRLELTDVKTVLSLFTQEDAGNGCKTQRALRHAPGAEPMGLLVLTKKMDVFRLRGGKGKEIKLRP